MEIWSTQHESWERMMEKVRVGIQTAQCKTLGACHLIKHSTQKHQKHKGTLIYLQTKTKKDLYDPDCLMFALKAKLYLLH